MKNYLTLSIRLCVTTTMREELEAIALGMQDDSGAAMTVGRLARKFILVGLKTPPKTFKMISLVTGTADTSIGIRLSPDLVKQVDRLVTQYKSQPTLVTINRSMLLRGMLVRGMEKQSKVGA